MTEPLPIEAFYECSRITEVALSPDGDRVAFVREEFDRGEDERRASLWVVPADGSREPHRLTRASDAGSPRWSPDGTRLGFLAARERDVGLAVADREPDDRSEGTDEGEEDERIGGTDGEEDNGGNGEGANEEPKRQVWVFDLELGGDARQITDREEGVRAFDWEPAGERIVVSARDPTEAEREYLRARREDDAPIETERLQHKWNGQGWLDTVTRYLFVVDVETRTERRLEDAYGGGAFEPLFGLRPTWGPAGIAFVSNRTDRPDDSAAMDLYRVDPEGGDAERLTDGELTVSAIEPSPDGERLAFAAFDPENWCVPTQVYCWDGESYESLTAPLDRTLARDAPLRWVDDSSLLTIVADEARTRPYRVRTDGEAKPVAGSLGEERSIETFDARDGTVALALSHPSDGLDVHTIGLEDLGTIDDGRTPGEDGGVEGSERDRSNDGDGNADAEFGAEALTRVTGVNDELIAEHGMPACERVTYESEDGEIDAICYHPPEFDPDDPEPRPLVVSIHGGPISYDVPEFRFEYAVWTSRGYIVCCPNYRGGSSYGRAFCESLRGRWGTVEVADIVAGIEALVDRGWADPERVFGRGFSYGGIAQGYLVTRTDVLTAAAPEHGIYDLRSEFGTSDSHIWTSLEFGLPWEERERYEAASSITDAGDIETPLLVMAGGEDWRCPPSQSEQLYVSARKQGVEAKLVVYPDEHHTIGDPDRAIHRLEQLTEWYERHDPGRKTDEQ